MKQYTLKVGFVTAIIELIRGLFVTFKHLFMPSVTIQYPTQRRPVAEGFRGLQRLNVDESGHLLCVGCGLCARHCPAEAIKLTCVPMDEPDAGGCDKMVSSYVIDISRCIFCGLCVDACPRDAIRMTGCYEMACYNRDKMIYDIKGLTKEPDVTKYK
ncbi:NADH-quinone oxidoreductase subunit I [bacterium]|nr:NADH-quinone oxidoreductase subunit I [bacterium]MBU1752518.1 NADH-quinone oxidoreductase subunit I [bacterium]